MIMPYLISEYCYFIKKTDKKIIFLHHIASNHTFFSIFSNNTVHNIAKFSYKLNKANARVQYVCLKI